ncbi:MAG TPA: hypothetical protein VFM86_00595 [Pedococcus sp.]|jgi:hypothetical protein|nr:hypothetical protein [Pedococcus sp.]
MSVLKATDASIAAASHLTDLDKGAVEMLRQLAAAADLIDENGLNPAGKLDNVTIPTYLRYAESLGLTPAGRSRAMIEKGKTDGGTSALGKLRSVHGKSA